MLPSRTTRVVRRIAAAALLSMLTLLPARRADAVIVERVVAVVGERPILLSELRHRARPFLYRIIAQAQNQAQQAAAESEMFKELLNRMIDDRLEEQAAEKARIVVSPEEIDNALKNVAAQAKMPPSQLVAEARRQGLTEQDYRDEIRRQLLEGKLVQLRVRGRVRVTDQDARAAYARFAKEVGEQQPIDIRILALRILAGSTANAAQARETLAGEIIMRARNGEDFCKLVEAYSDDQSTRDTCGTHGPRPFTDLVPEIQELVKTMRDGSVGGPVRIGSDALLIVQLRGKATIPPFDQVKELMMERAYGDSMERQRKLWLEELRHGVYLDVRL